jgi:hypothetical protein
MHRLSLGSVPRTRQRPAGVVRHTHEATVVNDRCAPRYRKGQTATRRAGGKRPVMSHRTRVDVFGASLGRHLKAAQEAAQDAADASRILRSIGEAGYAASQPLAPDDDPQRCSRWLAVNYLASQIQQHAIVVADKNRAAETLLGCMKRGGWE